LAPQREWFEKDYYKVLGVPENATAKEIGRAYRKLAKQYHPDAHPGSDERFKEISAAYDVLGDEQKRKEYDEVRRLGPIGNPFAGAGAAGAGRGFNANFRIDDLGDLLGNIFGRATRPGRGGGRSGTPPAARRGDDLETSVHLSFLDAVKGVTTTVNVTSEAACHTCGGSGAKPGTAPAVCKICGGKGVVSDNQGLFSFSHPCQNCGGTGLTVEHPCPTCVGSGTEMRARKVKVRIPAGVENGQRIRIKGRGGAGRSGGPPGDLYVVVHTSAHPVFQRRGKNLLITVPITFPEATLGTTIKVPTLDGPVSLKVPPGTKSGRILRVRGRGVPAASGAGDLLVTVEVVVPDHLNDVERQAVDTLAETMKGDSYREKLWSSA
jgi:molecular chaperone DnaJ